MARALGWVALIAAGVLFVAESVLDRRRRHQEANAPSARTIGLLVGLGGLLLLLGIGLLNYA